MNGYLANDCDAVCEAPRETTQARTALMFNMAKDALIKQKKIYGFLYGNINDTEEKDIPCECLDQCLERTLSILNELNNIQMKTIDRLGC